MAGIDQDRAGFLGLGLQLGIVSVEEIIDWADREIERLDEPPDSLIELALAGKYKRAEICSQLMGIYGGKPTAEILGPVLGRMHGVLKANPKLAPQLAADLYQTAIELFIESGLPSEMEFIWGIDDEFDLAIEGIYGNEREVYEGFLAATGRFANEF